MVAIKRAKKRSQDAERHQWQRLHRFRRRRREYHFCTAVIVAICCAKAVAVSFDPETSGETMSCAALPLPNATQYNDAALSSCTGAPLRLANVSDAWLDTLAMLYAPVLFFHPTEPFTLTAVDRTFANATTGGQILLQNQLWRRQLDPTTLLRTTRDPQWGLHQREFAIRHVLDATYQAGDGFYNTSNNTLLTRAPIYYHVSENDDAWIFQFYCYYTYHGGADLAAVWFEQNATQSATFQVPLLDEHEGDWPGLSVRVCPTRRPQTPLAVAYNYRHDNDHIVLDCTTQDCVLYRDTWHPVAFVARRTHRLYPVTASTLVTRAWPTNFVTNLVGVYSVERTRHANAMFWPNATNVVRWLSPPDIDMNSTPAAFHWMGYAGRWGGTTALQLDVGHTATQVPPSCTDASGTNVICPTSSVLQIVWQMLGFLDNDDNQFGRDLLDAVQTYLNRYGSSPFGPAAELSFGRWLPTENHPNLSCDLAWEAQQHEDVRPVHLETFPLRRNVNAIVTFCVVLVLLNALASVTPGTQSRATRPPLRFDEDTGAVLAPDRTSWLHLYQPAFLFTFFYLWTLLGLVLFFTGKALLTSSIIESLEWEVGRLETISYLLGFAVLIMNTIMLVLIWFPLRTCWLQLWIAYYNILDQPAQARAKQAKIRCGGRGMGTAFQFAYGVLFNSLILSTLCVLMGCLHVGIVLAVVEACNTVTHAANDVCVDLSAVAVQVACGRPFQHFCSSWDVSDPVLTLWGSVLIMSGHYYLISCAGTASSIIRVVPDLIALLPSSKTYRESLAARATESSKTLGQNGSTRANSNVSAPMWYPAAVV